ncbi:MAG: hypothetical protein CMH22_06290 [Methylophaga sp.]|nr:hypothetical protein [Methylophaga sp.]|tara:strand:- start:33152 stop:33367 length:216 start_codon:yes stop_codon:yes gene_type:complete
MSVIKQVKIITQNTQAVIIEKDQESNNIHLTTGEEVFEDYKSFLTYLTLEEAEVLGSELIKLANEIKNQNV